MSAQRFFCDQDCFGTTFCIPESRRNDWDEWMALDDYDERSWVTPTYAVKVINPTRLTFESPVESPPP